MAAQKRALDDSASTRKSKKSKTSSEEAKPATQAIKLVSEDVDFPRGGGTTFTPLEVKTIRAEAVKEANAELFEVGALMVYVLATIKTVSQDAQNDKSKKRKRKSEPGSSKKAVTAGDQGDKIRIEHLNYKVCLNILYPDTYLYLILAIKCRHENSGPSSIYIAPRSFNFIAKSIARSCPNH